MAAYVKIRINPAASATQVWTQIKDAVAVAGCAEIRHDPEGEGRLVLIAWFDEHVDWQHHHEVALNSAPKGARRSRGQTKKPSPRQRTLRGGGGRSRKKSDS
jgi:hypothetical protein